MYSRLPLSRTRTGSNNLFDIAGVRDIRTQYYYNKPYRKTRGNGNLSEIASCQDNRIRDSEARLYYTKHYRKTRGKYESVPDSELSR